VTSAALALAVAFFGLTFVVRSLVHRRRTGDFGFRLSAATGAARVAGVLMTSGFIVSFGGTVAVLAAPGLMLGGSDHVVLRSAGLATMAVGMAVTAMAQRDLRASWRIGVDPTERTDLVTDGVFRSSRNPIFAGMVTFAVGAALAVASWPTLAGCLAVIAGVEIQVRLVEEPYLEQTHGPAYRTYMAEVGRFLPKIGRRSVPDPATQNDSDDV